MNMKIDAYHSPSGAWYYPTFLEIPRIGIKKINYT